MNSRVKFLVVAASTCLGVFVLLGAMLGKSDSTTDGAYRQLGVYTEVLSHIKSDYVEEPDLKSVTLGAVNGLLEAVDPFASYLNADQYKDYQRDKDRYRGSVGLVLSKKYGYLNVVTAVPGSPAAKAGMKTLDILESIKGISTRDMPLAYADLLLQGEPGSTVEITLAATRRPDPQKVTLTRAAVPDPPLTSKMLPNSIGYIRPETLTAAKVGAIAGAVADLRRQGADRLILDLRQSAIGDPEDGIALANFFLDKGSLGYLQGQRFPRRDFNADATKDIWRAPLVVIADRGTAGAAEVAAGALLDDKRAEVVGERTYGNAAVRHAINMEDGGALILSVAKYYSPGGKALQDNGVTPSVPVAEAEPVPEVDEEGVTVSPEVPEAKPGEDLLLKKAIELLTGGSAKAAAAGAGAKP
jgi:carboxyl-terminal processing protease